MTLDEIKNLVNTLTYKPGTEFVVRQGTKHIPKHVIIIKVPVMALPSGRVDKAHLSIYLNPLDNREDILDNLYDLLRQWEMHELDEFFQINGNSIIDPHPQKE